MNTSINKRELPLCLRLGALAAMIIVCGSASNLHAEAKLQLKVVSVDSEETAGEDGKGTNAVDGNPSTIWHTQWQDSSPEHPHEIVIELTPPCQIKGFTYLPRQDESENGTIKDYEFYVSKDGKEFGKAVKKGSFENTKDQKSATFDPVRCRFVKLKALSEVNGEAWTSAAEIGVVPMELEAPATPDADKVSLRVVSVDSEETSGENGKGANAVDGDTSTIWHTSWQDSTPEHPHEIVIELTPPSKIKGFAYLPRQDDSDHGQIKDYEFYVSDDGKEFGKPVKKGSFGEGKDQKSATFEPVKCRFIKLKALSEINGEAWTSAAEIGVIRDTAR